MSQIYADETRKLYASLNGQDELELPKRIWERTLVAIPVYDKFGVIFNQDEKKIAGILSLCDVDMANLLPLFSKVGKRNNIRIYVKDNRPEVMSSLSLGAAVYCKHHGVSYAKDGDAHHILNSADNMVENIELASTRGGHPPKCFDSLVHFNNVFESYGLSYDEVVAFCNNYIKDKIRLDK